MIDVNVIDAFKMREHRHARFRLDARDEAFAAAQERSRRWRRRVPVEQQTNRGAIAGRHQRDRGLRQAGFAQSLHQAVIGLRGMRGNCPSRRAR